MKNALLFTTCLMFAACSQNSGNNTDVEQVATPPEPDNSTNVVATTEQPETVELPVFLSPDLGMLALNGQVAKVITKTYPADYQGVIDAEAEPSESTLEYDESGSIVYGLMGDYEWKTYERNTDHLIVKCSIKNTIVDVSYSFAYDEAKRISTATHYIDDTPDNTITYIYNVEGALIKETYKSKSDDRSSVSTYTIEQKDHHDNWTRRFEQLDIIEQSTKQTFYSITEREISYFGESATDDVAEQDSIE